MTVRQRWLRAPATTSICDPSRASGRALPRPAWHRLRMPADWPCRSLRPPSVRGRHDHLLDQRADQLERFILHGLVLEHLMQRGDLASVDLGHGRVQPGRLGLIIDRGRALIVRAVACIDRGPELLGFSALRSLWPAVPPPRRGTAERGSDEATAKPSGLERTQTIILDEQPSRREYEHWSAS